MSLPFIFLLASTALGTALNTASGPILSTTLWVLLFPFQLRERGTDVMVKVLTFPFTDCHTEVMSSLRIQFPQLENGNNRVVMKNK